MFVRPATPADASMFSELVARNLRLVAVDPSGAGTEEFCSQTSASAFAEYLASQRYSFLAALDGDRIVGFIGLRDRTHLMHLFIDPAHQRKGIGHQLWDAARLLDQPGYTVNASLNAQIFYQSLGFLPTGPAKKAYGVAYIPMEFAQPAGA